MHQIQIARLYGSPVLHFSRTHSEQLVKEKTSDQIKPLDVFNVLIFKLSIYLFRKPILVFEFKKYFLQECDLHYVMDSPKVIFDLLLNIEFRINLFLCNRKTRLTKMIQPKI